MENQRVTSGFQNKSRDVMPPPDSGLFNEKPAPIAVGNGPEIENNTPIVWHNAPLLSIARDELYARWWLSQAGLAYMRNHGLDWGDIAAFAGCLVFTNVSFLENRRFDFSDTDGTPAAVIEALDRDGETVIDLVAWPLDKPGAFASMFRRVSMLGTWHAFNTATYTFGEPLRLYRTPLGWLKAKCQGACIIDKAVAGRDLLDAPGPVACGNAAHALEVKAMFQALVSSRGLVPANRRAAA